MRLVLCYKQDRVSPFFMGKCAVSGQQQASNKALPMLWTLVEEARSQGTQ